MSLTGVDSHEYIMGGGAAIGLDVASLPQGMIFHFIHMCLTGLSQLVSPARKMGSAPE